MVKNPLCFLQIMFFIFFRFCHVQQSLLKCILVSITHPILQRLAQWQAKNVSQLTLTLRPHYSPAVTEYPLIRIVWPMTFWKDFGKKPCRSRNQSRQTLLIKRHRKYQSGVYVQWHHSEKFSIGFSLRQSHWPHLSPSEPFFTKAHRDLISGSVSKQTRHNCLENN